MCVTEGALAVASEGEPITVYSTDRPVEVAMIKLALNSAGIEYVAVNDVISAVLPVDGMAVVKFQVRREDVECALEVLRRHGHR